MKKCLIWMKKKAYWAVSAVLFAALAGAVILYENSGKEAYPVIFFGDSIVGNVRDETSITGLLEAELGVSVYNGAFGGSMLTKREVEDRAASMANSISMVELAKAMAADDFSVQNAGIATCAVMGYFPEAVYGFSRIDLHEAKMIIIEHGANDYLAGITRENPDDPMDIYTFGGALRTVLELLQKSYPETKIVLCTPTYCWLNRLGMDCAELDFGDGILEEYVNLELEIAEAYGVDVIDNYHDSGIGGAGIAFEMWSEYTEDGLHLNEQGRRLIVGRIADHVRGQIQ